MKNLILIAVFSMTYLTGFSSGLILEPDKAKKFDAMVQSYVSSMFSEKISSVDVLDIYNEEGSLILSFKKMNISKLSLNFLEDGNYKIVASKDDKQKDFFVVKKPD